MDAVTEPRSLLVLPDDIILMTLSFLHGKKRVKLSRTCKRISAVVDRSLKGVTKMTYEEWFGSKLDKYKTKVFSKLGNLQIFHAKTHNGLFCERISRILAKNCPNLREVRGHEKITELYAKYVHESGPVGIDLIFMGINWDIPFLEQLLQANPDMRTKAYDLEYEWMPGWFWSNIEDQLDVIRSRTTELDLGHANDYNLFVKEVTRISDWTSIRVLVINPNQTCERAEVRSLLKSLIQLEDIRLAMDVKDFDLFTNSEQKWKKISNLLHCAGEGKPDPGDCRHLIQFIEKREEDLSGLGVWLALELADNVDLKNYIFLNCKNLNHFRVDKGVTITYSEETRTLFITDFSDISLQPILRLFPKTKSIQITNSTPLSRKKMSAFLRIWKKEIDDFAATKRRYKVRSEILSKYK